MLHHEPASLKPDLRRRLHALLRGAASGELYAPQALLHANHPIGELQGPAAIEDGLWRPIRRAFRDARRVDGLFTGGSFAGSDWVSATGHLHGVLHAPFLGIPPTRNWASLRFGEFHRVEAGRVAASYLILDLPDLMRQAGVFPWRPGLGVETLQPGPATGDGVVLGTSDPAQSRASLELVEAMIFEGLIEPTAAGGLSTADQMRAYWTEDMMWYGPGLIGATMGIDGFYRCHEAPWERAMALRGPKPVPETKHVTRFGDGPFCSFTGWPSIHATHAGPFLGLPATGRPVEIRVMDFYHRRGDRLDENWVFIDFPHLFLQLGVDLLDRMAALRDGRPVERPWAG